MDFPDHLVPFSMSITVATVEEQQMSTVSGSRHGRKVREPGPLKPYCIERDKRMSQSELTQDSVALYSTTQIWHLPVVGSFIENLQ